MTYSVEKIIDKFGIENARKLVLEDGLSQIELQNALGISSSKKRLHSNVYKRIFTYLGIDNIPYSSDNSKIRKLKLEFEKYYGEYWKSEYIVEYLLEKVQNPTLNIADNSLRYVINFPKHPKANKDSHQVKAHVIVWEICNEQYVPEDCWIIPLDGNYTNLNIDNLLLVNKTVYKSKSMQAENNPAFKHGLSLRPKLGGWSKIAKDYLIRNSSCTLCKSTEDLLVHHIINYHLFAQPTNAHKDINLMSLCRSCHTKLHAHNFSIKAHIEETQYSKLLELLETLKSQVSDHNIEIYYDVEKQLGLTDNQQPST
jgi:hypothetical protein